MFKHSNIHFFNISEICKKINEKLISDIFRTFKSKLQIIHAGRRNEKNSGGHGATNQEILSGTMVGRLRTFFISDHLKQLEKGGK